MLTSSLEKIEVEVGYSFTFTISVSLFEDTFANVSVFHIRFTSLKKDR